MALAGWSLGVGQRVSVDDDDDLSVVTSSHEARGDAARSTEDPNWL